MTVFKKALIMVLSMLMTTRLSLKRLNQGRKMAALFKVTMASKSTVPRNKRPFKGSFSIKRKSPAASKNTLSHRCTTIVTCSMS